ncbi:Long-chain fatty acid transport protein 6 [Liparis tanakae]|uniref:Long-chain fatty acid transport protein 6 n=1 Tax=Liparis tanakae TaxID=230148 RepID=A0A4Z2FDH0_9TELE|nr:Long-chain fatty acid transport protein 6 [Liparis tanakae]
MGVGNGLRPDVWREFHRRFGEVKMCEVYGSTEGNLCFMNHIGKIGTVGRSNFFYRRGLWMHLVQTGDPDLLLRKNLFFNHQQLLDVCGE